jgi:hypothetical protein
MLIATTLSVASALLVSTALTTRLPVTAPPLVIGVTVAEDISPTLIPRVLDEAADIWRAAGLAIVWQLENGVAVQTPALRVWIGDATGTWQRNQVLQLGWIMFDGAKPSRDVYVSHANAHALLAMARDPVAADRMPRAEHETLLGRAMGRALAHELGHFLLASKHHTARGLMRARRTATEFFTRDRSRFALDAEQSAIVLSRYQPRGLLATAAISPAIPVESGGLAGSTPDDPMHFRMFARD